MSPCPVTRRSIISKVNTHTHLKLPRIIPYLSISTCNRLSIQNDGDNVETFFFPSSSDRHSQRVLPPEKPFHSVSFSSDLVRCQQFNGNGSFLYEHGSNISAVDGSSSACFCKWTLRFSDHQPSPLSALPTGVASSWFGITSNSSVTAVRAKYKLHVHGSISG